MLREILATDQAPAAIGPYSQAVRGEGRILFMSGQIPLTPSGELISGTVAVQTEQVMRNMAAVLETAGLGFSNLVRCTIYLSSMDHFAAVNEVYGKWVGTPPPARSTVAVAGLPRGVDVEIEGTAVY